MVFSKHNLGANFYCVSYCFRAFSVDRTRKYVLIVLKIKCTMHLYWYFQFIPRNKLWGFPFTSSILHLYFLSKLFLLNTNLITHLVHSQKFQNISSTITTNNMISEKKCIFIYTHIYIHICTYFCPMIYSTNDVLSNYLF